MDKKEQALRCLIICDEKADVEYGDKTTILLGKENCVSCVFKDNELVDKDEFFKKFRSETLKNIDVVLVLIGASTWKKKYVDWEIYASMLDDEITKRKGIIGLILPSREDYEKGHFVRYTVPPRLYDNYHNGYIKIYNWKDDQGFLQRISKKAVERKDMLVPVLNRPLLDKTVALSVSKWNIK
jgi:hypothetical protein